MKPKTKFIHFRINKKTGELLPYFRPYKNNGEKIDAGYEPAGKGGLTICFIMNDDMPKAFGIAECSMKDSFCYETGRRISFMRAMRQADGEKVIYHCPRKSPAQLLWKSFGSILDVVSSVDI